MFAAQDGTRRLDVSTVTDPPVPFDSVPDKAPELVALYKDFAAAGMVPLWTRFSEEPVYRALGLDRAQVGA
jgi:hypothetical protein